MLNRKSKCPSQLLSHFARVSLSLEHFQSFFLSRMLRCICSQTKAERFFKPPVLCTAENAPWQTRWDSCTSNLALFSRCKLPFVLGGRFEVCPPPPNSEGRGCSWDTVCWEGATLYFCFYILKQNLKAASRCAINILLIVMGTVLFRRKIRWGGKKQTNTHPGESFE